jgi:hypothetical protein
VTNIEVLKVVQTCQVVALHFLQIIIADVNVNYAFTKEKVREFRDMIMAQINLLKINQFQAYIFEHII